MTSDNASDFARTGENVRLFHVVPEDAVGGVEVAARQAQKRLGNAFQLHFLKASRTPDACDANVSYGPSNTAIGLRNAIAALRAARTFDPHVIIFSLWKTIFAFLLMRVMLRNRKFVLFLHSDRSTHFFDWLATAIMFALCDVVWADSASALDGRLGPRRSGKPERIISFVLHKPAAVARQEPKPAFVYWGRLNKIKAIDKSIDLFSLIAETRPDAEFLIIGPDSGSREELEIQIKSLGLADKVKFTGGLDMPQIVDATVRSAFYLQLSRQEGMAMSVVEAMQLGLVPIVTPVGAIRTYCRDGENAIVFRDMKAAVLAIDALLGDPERYRQMSASAISQWADAPVYEDEIIAAAGEVFHAA